MINVTGRKQSDEISTLSIGYFDIYNSASDRILLKSIITSTFSIGDKIYFAFRRQEDITSDDELKTLRTRIFKYFSESGQYIILYELDDRRFDSIGMIAFDFNTPNLIIDLWKYFYSCCFFRPKNDLTIDEYVEYLDINGTEDIDGLKHLQNLLTDCFFIKGLGADYLNISYISTEIDIYNSLLNMKKDFPHLAFD